MTRQEFTDRVLAPLGRLTEDERLAVLQELNEHVEDRMEAMLEMGWAEEVAEERCLEAMGDPDEIGREMAKQYRGWWLMWLGRAAAILTAVLCVQAFLALGILGQVWGGLEARFRPDAELQISGMESTDIIMPLDIRAEIGNDILRIYQVAIGEKDGQKAAYVSACMYDRWPFGIVANNAQCRLENKRGEAGNSGGGRGSYSVEYKLRWTPIEPGDTFVVWECRAFGELVRLEVPLPEGGGI